MREAEGRSMHIVDLAAAPPALQVAWFSSIVDLQRMHGSFIEEQ